MRQNSLTIFVYAMTPIDNWQAWLTQEQYLHNLKAPGSLYSDPSDPAAVEYFMMLCYGMGEARRRHGWDGDFSVGPMICPRDILSDEGGIVVGWKQSDNGTTFLVCLSKLGAGDYVMSESAVTVVHGHGVQT